MNNMDYETHTPGRAPAFTVSGAIAALNQIMETATPSLIVVGEVANFKINQGKWVFFDLKDDTGILNCFMPVYQLRIALTDGMKVAVVARPGLTKWGRFSLTVRQIKPVGEGSIKKSFELLKKKLAAEGLFAPERKRPLPVMPRHIGVVSSVDAAGYRDFIKIIGARMGGLTIDVISTQVQGSVAADQIIAAIRQFNELADPPEVLAILRGGGSRDDLAVFDDEKLVRTIAASRIPTITGVGHEIDTTLADLAADKRASTPSNAAELLVPDKREIIADINDQLAAMVQSVVASAEARRNHLNNDLLKISNSTERAMMTANQQLRTDLDRINQGTVSQLSQTKLRLKSLTDTLTAYNPRLVLQRGYALVWNRQHHIAMDAAVGEALTVETATKLIETEVTNVRSKIN